MQNIHKQTKLFIDNIEITEICFYTLKKSKSNYYNQYFRANMNNVKNTWKELIYIYNYIFIYNLLFQKKKIFQWFDHHQQNRDFKYL